jgi:hypothetical protein
MHLPGARPENLANLGQSLPLEAEGSARRPFISRGFPGTERQGAQWPSRAESDWGGGNALSIQT